MNLMHYISTHPGCSSREISEALGLPLDTVRREVKSLVIQKRVLSQPREGPGTERVYRVMVKGPQVAPRPEYKGEKLPYRYVPRNQSAVSLPGFQWIESEQEK